MFKNIKSFLKFANFYLQFINNYLKITNLFIFLTKKILCLYKSVLIKLRFKSLKTYLYLILFQLNKILTYKLY